MTIAIEPACVAQILPLEVFSTERGGRNTVVSAQGRVASDIELIEYDEESRIARYELRVANDAPSMLTCYAYAVRGKRNKGERPLTCTSIAVMPHSGVSVTFELPLPFVGTYDRITVEMHGDSLDVSSDTIPPGRDEPLLIRRAVSLAIAIVCTVILAFAGVAQPQVFALSAPSEALGGSLIHVAYEARGLGALSYGLTNADGSVVQRGVTHPGIGSLNFRLPTVAKSQTFYARVEMHTMFGGDSKMAVVRDLATPIPLILRITKNPASIAALCVNRSIVRSGEPIVISYNFKAARGNLRLIDDVDTVWSAVSVSHSGKTILRAPHVDHNEDLRLALHVERGGSSADSQVGLQIAPATPAPLRFRSVPGAPLEISAGPVKAGQAIPIRIIRSVSDLHVALQNSQGVEVESFNVDGTQAALHVPQHVTNSKYTVIVTFADRNGQETVVIPLTITRS